MVIDEENKFVLTNYEQVRKGGIADDSDHHIQFMELEQDIKSEKQERKEIFNFKNEGEQIRFNQHTSETTAFSTGESTIERLCSFFLRNSSLRLEFLLCVEGLVFFLNPELINSFLVVSKEKEKVWPIVREK